MGRYLIQQATIVGSHRLVESHPWSGGARRVVGETSDHLREYRSELGMAKALHQVSWHPMRPSLSSGTGVDSVPDDRIPADHRLQGREEVRHLGLLLPTEGVQTSTAEREGESLVPGTRSFAHAVAARPGMRNKFDALGCRPVNRDRARSGIRHLIILRR
jgi:hypothetical protein